MPRKSTQLIIRLVETKGNDAKSSFISDDDAKYVEVPSKVSPTQVHLFANSTSLILRSRHLYKQVPRISA